MSRFRAVSLLTGLVLLSLVVLPVFAAPTEEELKKANNPLANSKAVNFQNYYYSNLSGSGDATANTFWVRGVVPFGRVLVRASLPLPTVPLGGGDSQSGLGDLNAFAAYLAVQKADVNFGIGPLLAAPTASDDALGSGKWQAGGAMVVFMMPSAQVQYGGLVTYQASIAGDDDRNDTSLLAVQPFLMLQLGGGTYLRSAPIWAFDLENDSYNVPFGLGIGKVVKLPDMVLNLFLEPQYTILHDGVGQPLFQVFTGLNTQF